MSLPPTPATRTWSLRVNGELHQVAAREDEPLLWVLRDQLGLTGAKFGCGEGLCDHLPLTPGDVKGALA